MPIPAISAGLQAGARGRSQFTVCCLINEQSGLFCLFFAHELSRNCHHGGAPARCDSESINKIKTLALAAGVWHGV
jgi:hypothetical protein